VEVQQFPFMVVIVVVVIVVTGHDGSSRTGPTLASGLSCLRCLYLSNENTRNKVFHDQQPSMLAARSASGSCQRQGEQADGPNPVIWQATVVKEQGQSEPQLFLAASS
jgi:hypothetical protein